MASLSEIVTFLDRELRISEIPDYPGAHNGLQLENSGQVSKVAVAVDASLAVIEEAVEIGADLLIVHHGLFWQGVRMLTGAQYQKLKLAIDGGLAIYSSHIPLDVHPQWGNNALLAKALGLRVDDQFLDWKGLPLGISGHWEGNLSELQSKVAQVVGPTIQSYSKDGPVGRLGIITGGAGSEIEKVRAAGIDTFLTGEGPHWSFPLSNELGLNVIHAGHYATEVFGVQCLGSELKREFGINFSYLSHPTGL